MTDECEDFHFFSGLVAVLAGFRGTYFACIEVAREPVDEVVDKRKWEGRRRVEVAFGCSRPGVWVGNVEG